MEQLQPLKEEQALLDCLQMIRGHYGTRCARRSGVLLINHIHEGLQLLSLRTYGALPLVRAAYCLHPMFQADWDLVANAYLSDQIDPRVMMLVMEYRNIANQYLSWRHLEDPAKIVLSPLHGVNDMLWADKIQNYKDFLTYHQDTHERRHELNTYFKNWLSRLKVSDDKFDMYCRMLAK